MSSVSSVCSVSVDFVGIFGVGRFRRYIRFQSISVDVAECIVRKGGWFRPVLSIASVPEYLSDDVAWFCFSFAALMLYVEAGSVIDDSFFSLFFLPCFGERFLAFSVVFILFLGAGWVFVFDFYPKLSGLPSPPLFSARCVYFL